MMDSLSKCFNGFQERYESVLEAKSIFRDDSDITSPLNGSECSVEPIKKSRSLQRAKRIDRSLRFEDENEEMAQPLKPRKVVRFQLEKNKIFEPNKPVRYELEPEEKPLGEKEGSNKVEGKDEVVRVKIKMTRQEAEKLLAKCKDDSVLDLEHVVDQIAYFSNHQLQLDVVVVASKL